MTPTRCLRYDVRVSRLTRRDKPDIFREMDVIDMLDLPEYSFPMYSVSK